MSHGASPSPWWTANAICLTAVQRRVRRGGGSGVGDECKRGHDGYPQAQAPQAEHGPTMRFQRMAAKAAGATPGKRAPLTSRARARERERRASIREFTPHGIEIR